MCPPDANIPLVGQLSRTPSHIRDETEKGTLTFLEKVSVPFWISW